MTSSQSYTPRPTTSEPGIISPYPVIWARPISLSCSDSVLQYIITPGKLSEWPLLHAIRWEMGVAIVAGWDHRLELNVISINMAITSCERRRQWFLTRMPWIDVKFLGATEPLCRGYITLLNMDGSSLQLNPSTGLMGFLRHWMVSMHDDLRRTGHWLKASSWRWLHELSISSKLLLVQSGGCICLYHMWPCSSCTVQSVFMTKWYNFDIAWVILTVGSC